MIKKVKILGGLFILLYGTSLILVYLFQRHLIFLPTPQDFEACDYFADAQKLNENGTRFYYKSVSDKLVVFYHGNYGSACDRAFLSSWFEASGYSVAFVEYVGYSNDRRAPRARLILQDVKNMDNFIRRIAPNKLVVVGESLGTGPASYHASLDRMARLILISPYTSLLELSEKKLPFYPVSFMLREHFDNVASLKDFYGGMLVIAGTNDLVVPIEFSRKLFEKVPTANKTFLEIQNAGHVDGLYFFSQTELAIQHFLGE